MMNRVEQNLHGTQIGLKTRNAFVALTSIALSGCASILSGTVPSDLSVLQGFILVCFVVVAIPASLVAITALLAPPPNRSAWIASALLSFVATAVVGFLVGVSKLNGGSTMPLVYGLILTALTLFSVSLLIARIRWSRAQTRLPIDQRWGARAGPSGRVVLWAFVAITLIATVGIGLYHQPRMSQSYQAHKWQRDIEQTRKSAEGHKSAGGKDSPPPQSDPKKEYILGNIDFMPITKDDIASQFTGENAKPQLQNLIYDTCRIDVVADSTVAEARAGIGMVWFTIYPGKDGAGALLKLRNGSEPFRVTWGQLINQRLERIPAIGSPDDQLPYFMKVGLPGWGVLGLRIDEPLQCSSDRKTCLTTAQFFSAASYGASPIVVLRETCAANLPQHRLFSPALYAN